MAEETRKTVAVEQQTHDDTPPGPGPEGDAIPKVLPVLPLSDVVLFPSMVAPLVVTTARSIRLIDSVVSGNRFLLCVLQRNRMASDDAVELKDLQEYGCVARLIKMLKFPDETVRILVQGLSRCCITRPHENAHYLEAHYATLKDDGEDPVELTALARNATRARQIRWTCMSARACACAAFCLA